PGGDREAARNYRWRGSLGGPGVRACAQPGHGAAGEPLPGAALTVTGRRRMPGRRRRGSLAVVLVFLVGYAAASSVASVGTSEGVEDALTNCNEVSEADRCACNERILYALTNRRPVVAETEGVSWTSMEFHNMVAMQQERLHRLRTFHAPDGCNNNPKNSEKSLPIAPQHRGSWTDLERVKESLRPFKTNQIDITPNQDAKVAYIAPELLLPGRWEGWQ